MKKTLLLLLFSIVFSITSFAQAPVEVDWLNYPYPMEVVFGFEQAGDNNYIGIDTSQTGNLWQIGHPQKTTFSSAIIGQNALVTDTINTYPANNVSSFQIRVINYQAYLCAYIQFKHKYQTTAGQDGGTIEVSHDQGITWMNVIQDSLFLFDYNCGLGIPPYTINDTVAALGKPGFSGNSNGSQSVVLDFMPLHPSINGNDTIDLRFTFASDSVNENMDGWMLDEFSVDAMGEGIRDYSSDHSLTFFPNPSSGIFEIRNELPNEEKLISVYDVAGKKVFNQKTNGKEIDLSFLDNGLYQVIVDSETRHITQRVVIAH